MAGRKKKRKSAKTLPKERGIQRLIAYLRSTGARSIILGVASLMMLGPDGFPCFAALLYVAVIIWTADVFLEIRQSGRIAKTAVGLGGFMIVALMSWRIVFVRLPIGLLAYSSDVDYPPGTIENGIQWSPKYTDLQVIVSNSTQYDYSQVDLLIRPMEPVIAGSVTTSSPAASLNRQMSITSFDLQLYRPSTKQRFEVPSICWASTGGFRLHVDSLPADTHISVVLALANIDESKTNNSDYYPGPWKVGENKFFFSWQSHPLSDDLFKARPEPQPADISGSYVAFYRREHLSETMPVGNPWANVIKNLPAPKH
jgi:hypothetical protein